VDFAEDVRALGPEIERLMAAGERVNANLAGKYWYPLAMATYGTDEVLAALTSLCSFRTTMWEKTAQFEAAFGEMFGGEAIMVNSGSSADLLVAFGMHELSGGPLKSGDEILAPAVTWPTQLWSLLMAGFAVRLVDVDPNTLNMDLADLERSITPKTKAISLVHLMGNPVDMDRIQEICQKHDLLLIEDCCESLGAKWRGQGVGTFGLAGTFSFFFSHHLTTMEGGMILTTDPELAERYRLLRAHGWSRNLRNPPEAHDGLDPRYTFLSWGFNVRPTELQAGFGLVQLERFANFQQHRYRNAALFQQRMAIHRDRIRVMQVPEGGECSWFAIPLTVAEDAGFTRDELAAFLEAEGVETRPVVAGNLATHPAAAGFPMLTFGELPGAELIHELGMYLGLHPVDSAENLSRVCDLIDRFITGADPNKTTS
jgi:CDP-6-deoxy-D-xylo-4-hexulose-3-dehydrase